MCSEFELIATTRPFNFMGTKPNHLHPWKFAFKKVIKMYPCIKDLIFFHLVTQDVTLCNK